MKQKNTKKRVFVGLSGGVDSSVAAYLLKKKDYDVVGVHIRCWNEGGCDVKEAEYARRAAEHLNIPFYLFNLEKEYKEAVVDYMISGYKSGITPNPDVMCNREIKFGLFLRKAIELGADYVATGHYVCLQQTHLTLDTKLLTKKSDAQGQGSRVKCQLFSARDAQKDQSYFLWTLTQDQLRRCLFPIGDYLKKDVRKIARRIGLPNADKKDSQGICFIGEVQIKDFLARYIKKKQGNIADESGKILGLHDGAQFYTIGQRHGLKIGGSDKPYYVARKDIKRNLVIAAKGETNQALYKKEIKLANVNFINPNYQLSAKSYKLFVRVRYRQPLFSACLYKLTAKSYKLTFDKPQKFIAPGQSAVFYEKGPSTSSGLKMLGGGIIL